MRRTRKLHLRRGKVRLRREGVIEQDAGDGRLATHLVRSPQLSRRIASSHPETSPTARR